MPRALQWPCGGVAVSYERGTPVQVRFGRALTSVVPLVTLQQYVYISISTIMST